MKPASDFEQALPRNLYRQIIDEHPYRIPTPSKAIKGEVVIDKRWSIVCDPSCGTMCAMAAGHLRATLKKTFGISIASKRSPIAIEVRVDGSIDDNPETFRVHATPAGVRIVAASDEGAMRALFQLDWDMLNRQRPVIVLGERTFTPQWKLRIASPVLHKPLDEAGDYLKLPRSYLLNLARYGYNATYLYINWFEFMSPASGGALSSAGWQQRLDDLRKTVDYLAEFGIRLFFHVNMLALPADHALFKGDSQLRGAQTWTDDMHCVCTSAPASLKLFERASQQLFTDVPNLAGAVLIVGGECFLHCYTRPFPKPPEGTNCKRCAKQSPDKVVAGALNAFARGIKAAGSNAQVLAWPYSAFSWGDTKTQIAMFKQLDPEIAFLSSFEKDDWIKIDGVSSYVFDYSIASMGPSPLFKELSNATRKQGRETYARTEVSQCIEMFNVPRIPVMSRWAERFEKLRDAKLTGIHTAWRFYGFCAQRTDEVMNYFNWAQKPDIDELLNTMAVRDFGKSAASGVVRSWKLLSDAFALFPYGGGVTGFPYFRGPFSIGAAHPFVFDLTYATGLSQDFSAIDPSMEEGITDLEKLEVYRQPRYFVDTTWTQPFGAKVAAKRFAEIDRDWSRGVSLLQKAHAKTDGENKRRLESEIGVAQLIGTMFRTASNLVRFQMLRDNVTSQPTTMASLTRTCDQAISILKDELENAKLALKLTQADPSLGYGATYGYAFTADLIRQKIEHTEREMKQRIPYFKMIHAFHCFGVFVQD